jgi:hypothetical protein
MFVWALRDKGSEWRAMRQFLERGRLPFVPLVEAVCEPFLPGSGQRPQSPGTVTNRLGVNLGALTDSGRVWVDLNHLGQIFSGSDLVELHRVLRTNQELAFNSITPVVRTSSSSDVIDEACRWAFEEGCGLGIRVDGLTRLRQKSDILVDIIRASGLRPDNIDVILDGQDLPRAVGHEEMADAFPTSQITRTFVVLAGTFPRSITDMDPDTYEHTRERGEWTTWREEMQREGNWRRPLYGDYATQPALYVPSPSFPGSPTVRYTTGETFVILRGRGAVRGQGPDYSQYIGHARFLRQQSYYRDIATTECDSYVERIAARTNGSGTPSTWRVASLERHVTVVSAQVAQFETANARMS